jgi:regulator of cell morphogenesis and NO signaling
MLQRNELVSDIVTKDYRKAAILRDYGIDFCCGGKVPVGAVCEKMGIDFDELAIKLEDMRDFSEPQDDFHSWSLSRLCDYIVGYHHSYIREAIPRISFFTQKLSNKHGEYNPWLVQIHETFEGLSKELLEHADDEEARVFPALKSLEKGELSDYSLLNSMIDELETEHAAAGKALEKIRLLTSNYSPPEWACNSFGIFYKEMEAFELDLHRHVHLENNVLFSKVSEMV